MSGHHVERLARWPDLVALHRRDPKRYPFLLESIAHGPEHARWDILFVEPGERLWQDAAGRLHGSADCGDFLGSLDAWVAREGFPRAGVARDLPFLGGWFVFCAYELAGDIEPVLRVPIDGEDPLPRACAVRTRSAILRDHHLGEAWLVAEPGAHAGLTRTREDLAARPIVHAATSPPVEGFVEEPPQRYLAAVERARRYIHDGDIFQANLSRAWRGHLSEGATAFDCYLALRARNPAPFAGFMRWTESVAIASSSPERLVKVSGRRIETRPIAGTRRRGADAEADAALTRELIDHPKERAEHVMLVDLERNDLGRVCEFGSVEVDEMMVVESYATVHHIVSNVSGHLREQISPGKVIAAVFPGGTITGCPKVRCMQIIAELEGEPRGAYTGSFGWLGHDGDMDLNILIRTLTVRHREVTLRAGAGIVAESVPERELDESQAKASGLLRAFGVME